MNNTQHGGNARELIQNILKEMYSTAKGQQTMSPNWWIDEATKLNALRQHLDHAIVECEMQYKSEIAERIDMGDKITEAKLKVESKSESYKLYRRFTAMEKQVDEQIKLAKKRATIEEI